VHFELYASKTIKQCLADINARFQEKESKARPGISGYTEKTGEFHLYTATTVLGLRRNTHLRGTMEKVKDVTILRGYVSSGVQKEQAYVIMGAMMLTALAMLLLGQAIFSIVIMIIAVAGYVPLVGDYHNSQYLIKELRRITGAKDKPPASLQQEQGPKAAKSPARPAPKTPARSGPPPKKPASSQKPLKV
jgi:hypothetical protein